MLYQFRHFFLPRLVGLVVKAPLPKAVVRGCGTSPAPRRAWCPGRPGMGCTPPWRCQTGVTMSWLSLAQPSFTSQTPPTQTGRTSSSGRLLWECQLPMEMAFNPALSCLMQVRIATSAQASTPHNQGKERRLNCCRFFRSIFSHR